MSDRSIRATGLVALALSCCVLVYSWSLLDRSRRVVAAAVAKNEAWRARMKVLIDRQDEEIAEAKSMLEKLIQAEAEQARRVRRAPWGSRFD